MSVYEMGRREDGKTGGREVAVQAVPAPEQDPSHTEPSKASRLRGLRRFAGWGVLALVLLVGLSGCGLGTDENPYTSIDPQTGVTDDIQGLYKTIFYMATVVFVLVQFLILYTALRYRRKRRSATRPAQVHGNSRLEITWTIIPAVVLLIILVPTISILYSLDADAEDDDGAMVVEVYGKQWWWELHYPGMGPDETQPLVTANEVRLPVDQKVIFRLQSNNVIHSFWVPQLSGKMDVMPGYENKMTFTTPNEPGEYYGECAEFCGVDHAWMRFKVIVMPQEEFDAWVAAWNAPAAYDANPATQGISEAPAALGACVACHSVSNAADARGNSLNNPATAGFEAAYTAGPNLTLIGCRESFAGGLMTTNEENLRAWLRDPSSVKEANLMGTVIKQGTLNDQQITELVAYLLALRLPDGSCPSDLANTDASGGVPAAPGGVPEGVATPAATPAPPATPAATPGATPEGGQGSPTAPVELSAPGIAWSTNELTVPQGGVIRLINDGSGGPHNFVIEGYNDDAPVDMPPGSQTDWTVPSDLAPGTYTFYCAVPGHRQAGMEGTITILPPAGGGETPPPADGAAAAQTIEMGDIYFGTTELTIPASTDVTITLSNVGASVHNFNIDAKNNESDPGIHSGDVSPGESGTVTVNLPPGTWYFYCSIPGHEAAGMHGTITVT
jgi:cytochrome c oxidase subunit 2